MDQVISFDEIAADWRVPGSYVEIKPVYDNMGLADAPSRALLIGQMLPAGTAPAGVPQRITRRDQARALFGAGSVAEAMVNAFLDANTTTEVFAMGLAAPGGAVAAAGAVALSGTVTGAGTLAVYIGGRRVGVPVGVAATPAAIATALAAAINAGGLPVTAAAASGTVTLTARHAGVVGNALDLRINHARDDATPAGLVVGITAMAGGAGVPDVAAALAGVAADHYTDIALAWTDSTSLGAFTTELGRRYQAMTVLDARGYIGLTGTHGALLSAGAALNSPHLVPIGADRSPSPPWAWAASLCGRCAFHLANDPARQLRSITLPGLLAPLPVHRFTAIEQDLLLRDGIGTWDVQQDGTVTLSRVVTSYQVSALGVPDTAWLDVMVPATMSRLRYDWRAYLALTYPRHKLADDDSPAAEYSSAVVTPRRMHGAWAARCKLYERQGWIEDAKRTAERSVFVRDGADRNRLNAAQYVRVIGNLMVFAASLEFEA